MFNCKQLIFMEVIKLDDKLIFFALFVSNTNKR